MPSRHKPSAESSMARPGGNSSVSLAMQAPTAGCFHMSRSLQLRDNDPLLASCRQTGMNLITWACGERCFKKQCLKRRADVLSDGNVGDQRCTSVPSNCHDLPCREDYFWRKAQAECTETPWWRILSAGLIQQECLGLTSIQGRTIQSWHALCKKGNRAYLYSQA